MKRVLVLVAVITISISAFSQNYKQAIGVKIGKTVALEYKLNASPQNFLIMGLHFRPWQKDKGLYFSGYYNWSYNIDPVPGLSWYVGPGANIGASFFPSTNLFYLSINAMLGIEYKFDTIPLALAIDFTPGAGMAPNLHFSWNIGLGIKYAF